MAWQGVAWQGSRGERWRREAWLGAAVEARRDVARQGTARSTLFKRERNEKLAQAERETTIDLQPIKRSIIPVEIVGVTPLIPHKWSEKAKRLMREAQSGVKTKAARDPKVPQEEAEASLYRLPDGTPGMPSTAFKAAMVGAVRLFQGLTMVQAKSSLFVLGEGPDQLVRIDAGDLILREDTPRNANGNADLRYRYALWPWTAVLEIEYLESFISESSVVALLDAAGDGGVGDWRPSAPKSHTGTFGRFRVKALTA